MSDKPIGFAYALERVLEAPRADVWRAWTTPKDYEQWANTAPSSVEMDVRAGGRWKAIMVVGETEIPLAGSYLEVVENERLVLGMDVPGRPEPIAMTVSLTDAEGATRITVGQSCDTEAERNDAEQGSGVLLDSLEAFVTSR